MVRTPEVSKHHPPADLSLTGQVVQGPHSVHNFFLLKILSLFKTFFFQNSIAPYVLLYNPSLSLYMQRIFFLDNLECNPFASCWKLTLPFLNIAQYFFF